MLVRARQVNEESGCGAWQAEGRFLAMSSSGWWQQFGAMGPTVLGSGGFLFFHIYFFLALSGLSCGMWDLSPWLRLLSSWGMQV